MTTSKTKLTYYNGWWWRTALLADGTRVVQPYRKGGGPVSHATPRYYRAPGRAGSWVFRKPREGSIMKASPVTESGATHAGACRHGTD
jgi:hypothetical protein